MRSTLATTFVGLAGLGQSAPFNSRAGVVECGGAIGAAYIRAFRSSVVNKLFFSLTSRFHPATETNAINGANHVMAIPMIATGLKGPVSMFHTGGVGGSGTVANGSPFFVDRPGYRGSANFPAWPATVSVNQAHPDALFSQDSVRVQGNVSAVFFAYFHTCQGLICSLCVENSTSSSSTLVPTLFQCLPLIPGAPLSSL